jgi:hypothetical protein
MRENSLEKRSILQEKSMVTTNGKDLTQFEKELTELINKHSVENVVNMPDFMLSKMMTEMIGTIGEHVLNRDKYLKNAPPFFWNKLTDL